MTAADLRTVDLGDGELRGAGGYCLLPPSLHPDGPRYTWLVPLNGDVPTFDPRAAGLHRAWNCTESGESTVQSEQRCTERTETTEGTEGTEKTEAVSAPPQKSRGVRAGVVSISEAVELAIPAKEHCNHHLVFVLARSLKAYQQQHGTVLDDAALWAAFGQWFKKATSFLRPGKSRDDYWLEFLDAWENAKYPLGEGLVTQALDAARKATPPAIAGRFQNPDLRLLVALCRELQRNAGDEPFYLAGRTVARLFKHDTHTTAALWLRGLCRMKILEIAVKGGPATNKATRFYYRGD